jgi:catechol 2,3-dioxygenase
MVGGTTVLRGAVMTTADRPQGPIVPALAGDPPIDPQLRIGHVHLRTADIDRVRDFYVGVMGFDVVFEARDVPGWGTTGDILFLSAGGYHHHLGFNTWKSAGGGPQPDGVTGLHHVALNFSTEQRLAQVVQRLVDAGVALRQLTDHGTHKAVYLSDPDGNDLELAWDRPVAQWPVADGGRPVFADSELDLDALLALAA